VNLIEVGIIAVIFGIVVFEVTKKDVPKPLIWLAAAFAAAINLS
jgi:hypothetical protein